MRSGALILYEKEPLCYIWAVPSDGHRHVQEEGIAYETNGVDINATLHAVCLFAHTVIVGREYVAV